MRFRYFRQMIVLFSLLFAFILFNPLQAQDAVKYTPGEDSPATGGSKARARYEYFYNRLTYPGGEIPEGARVKAFGKVKESMRFYQPGTGWSVQSAMEWKNAGPFNIGGRIFALALNPKNSNTIFIGAADGGIWRSYDGAKTWQSVSDDLPTQSMGSIVINPVDTNIIYAGTGDASFGSLSFDGGGMFKSTDAGTSWFQIGGSTLPLYSRASDMAINPLNPDILFAAIPDGTRDPSLIGIWRSKNAGDSWELVLTGRMTDIVINPQDPDVLYTVSSKMFGGSTADRYGMFKTTDGGDTWNRLDIGVTDSLIGRTGIGICAGNPNVLYIGVSQITGQEKTPLLGVFKTTDAGVTWKKLDVPFDYMASQGWFDNIIGVHPTNPDIVYAGGVKMIRSSDGGATWERMPDQLAGGILHVDQHEIEFDPFNPDRVFVGNDGGLYLSTQEGKRWEKTDLGLSITQFIGGAMHPASDAFLFGGTQDNGTMLSDSAPMFDPVLYGDGGNGAINPLKPNVIYTTQERLKLWRSDDFGQTWSWAVGDMPNHQSLFYIPYEMDPQNPNTLYLGTYRMYKTTNEGRSWNLLQNCLFPVNTSCYYISAVSIARYDNRLILAGAPGQVGISQDGGATWRVKSGQLPVATCSSVKSFSPNVIYTTFSRYGVDKVWRSTDMGENWISVNGNLPDIPVNDIIQLDSKLIIGTDLGAFVSENEGTEWQRLGTGMPSVSVQKFIYNENTGTLRAITHGRGMYDLEWKQPPPSQPAFTSNPDTSILQMRQPFLYAPVVTGSPSPVFSLVEGPQGATIDPVFGTVRWNATDKLARFTIEASNAAGTARQVFSLYANEVAVADWEIISPQPTSSAVNHLMCAGDKSLWMARDTAWISRSTDGGATWEHMQLPGTGASVISLYAFDKDRGIAGTGGPQSLVNTGSGHLWKTADGGKTWRDVLYGIDSRFGNIHFWDAMNGIAISQGAQDSADVFLTTDGGESWKLVVPRPHARIPLYNTLCFADRMNGWFASSNEYASPVGDAVVLRTTDGGLTWTAKSAGAGMRYVSDVSFLSPTKGFLVDEMSGKVRKTANGGQAWSSAFYPMGGLRNVSVQTDPVSNMIWIISDTSAWVSANEGITWTRTQLVPCGAIQAAAFADSAHGWVVSKTGIVQRLISSPVSVVSESGSAPAEMILGAAYPNPVVGEHNVCAIPFTLPTKSHITLRIYNSSGKELVTLMDHNLPAGQHFAAWDVSGLSSGVYFYSLASGNQKVTRRIVVAR